MIARIASSTRRLRGDRRGATIVEFGLIILPLTITLLVLFDFGYRMYAQAVLEGTLHQAARQATIGNKTTIQIDDFVKARLKVFSKDRDPVIVKKSYYQFSGVDKCEKDLVNPDAPAGSPSILDDCILQSGECYIDENKNGRYDQKLDSGTSGLGRSDDIIFYTVTMTFARIVPLGRLMGWSNDESVTANTVLRNQPYGAQTALPTPTCP